MDYMGSGPLPRPRLQPAPSPDPHMLPPGKPPPVRPQDRCAALQALASQLHTARGDLQSAMGGLVQHLDVLSRAPDPCRAWMAMLGQLTHQAASGQLPEGHHFLRTLAAVAREAVGRDEGGFAAGLACLMASSCASAGDLGQVHTDAWCRLSLLRVRLVPLQRTV